MVRPLVASSLLATSLVAGCAEQSASSTTEAPLLAGTPGANRYPTLGEGPVAKPGGVSQTSYARAAVLPLGAVPYDNLSLPMVSPDGALIATQAGFPPTWPTLRAEPRAEVPFDLRLHIYMIDYREPGVQTGEVTLMKTVDEPVLLGRACNHEGFLVEAPQSDGSRWIGLCRWNDGEITWLVTGVDVNALATINASGELAWCRRPTGGDHFELVVRRRDGSEVALATPGEDWLMPVWARQPDRLFAFHLRGGKLDATYHSVISDTALARPLHRLPLAVEASVDTAYQSMAPHPSTTAATSAGTERLVFFHPYHARTVIWQPLEPTSLRLIAVPGESITAYIDDSRYALVTTSEHLVRQDLLSPPDRQALLKGLLIVRPTTNEEWPYVLLSPARPGRIGLTALHLLPVPLDDR